MVNLKERIETSHIVFEGRLLTVKVENVTLEDGVSATREVVYHPGAVAIVPLTENSGVVLVRQYRLATGQTLLEIPAGVLHTGETPEACARRELAEEIGMAPGRLDHLASFYLAPGYSSEIIHLFEARDLQPQWAQADDDERLDVVEIPFDKALQAIDRGEMTDAKTIAGLLMTARRRNERTYPCCKE